MRRTRLWRTCALLALLCAAVAGLLGFAPSVALGDEPAPDAPAHTKRVERNVEDGAWDGTYTVTLDVTGAASSSSHKTSANVILVMDVSGSMDLNVPVAPDQPDESRTYLARVRVMGGVSWEPVTYRDGAWRLEDGTEWTGDLYDQATRLEVAKSALNTLSQDLIGSEDSIIKLSLVTFSDAVVGADGPYAGGQALDFDDAANAMASSGETNWEAALHKANELAAGVDDPTYVIFVSDGEPNVAGGQVVPATQAFEVAAREISAATYDDQGAWTSGMPQNVRAVYSIYTGAEATTYMNAFAARTGAGTAYDGTNLTNLNRALADIVQTIRNGFGYAGVSICDTLSPYVDFAEDEPTFELTRTDANGTMPLAGGAAQVLEDSTGRKCGVVVDLSGVTENGQLEDGVTYSVGFRVKANQLAYDTAARMAGEDQSLADAGAVDLDTNGAASVRYAAKTMRNNQVSTVAGEAPYDAQTIPVPVSQITITKTWDGEIQRAPATFDLVDGEGAFSSWGITLNPPADGQKVASVSLPVAAGPEGHVYTVTERADDASGWEPDGSAPDGVRLDWTVGALGDMAVLEAQSGEAAFRNVPVLYELRLTKVANGGGKPTQTPLAGAKFQLMQGKIALDTQVTGKDGTARFCGLHASDYTVTEVEAPAGYVAGADHTLTIKADGTYVWDSDPAARVGGERIIGEVVGNDPEPAEPANTKPGQAKPEQVKPVESKAEQAASAQLPNTGGPGTAAYLGGGAAALITAILAGGRLRRK